MKILLRWLAMLVVNIAFFTATAAIMAFVGYLVAQLGKWGSPDFALYFKNMWWALLVIWALIRCLEFLTGKEILDR